MDTTSKVGRRSIRPWHGGPVLLILGLVLALVGALQTTTARSASALDTDNDRKVYVCKYVGQPGVEERLQTGQNPIWVSESSIKLADGQVLEVGSLLFADAQTFSRVVQIGGEDPGIGACVTPLTPTTTTEAPTTTAAPTTTEAATTTEAPTTTAAAAAAAATTTEAPTTTAAAAAAAATTTAAPTTLVGQAGPQTPTAVGASEGSLPSTGNPSWPLIVLGSMLMVAGMALTFIGRRRDGRLTI